MEITAASNKVFYPVHMSRKRYVIMKGSAGSGKSTDTAQQYIIRLMADKGRNLLCVRKAEVTNRDSTFAELTGAINRLGVGRYWRSTVNPLAVVCVNGNKIIFRGVNHEREREKLKSITFETGSLTDVWIEEMTEITKSDFEIIDDRLRGRLPEGLFYQIKGTFNPVSVNHWVKKSFFDFKDSDVFTHHSTYLDNRFVDEAYKRRMMRRKELDPEGYLVYGLGCWGEVAGLVLHNWKPDEISQNPDDYDGVALGQDFGFNHANAILLLGYKDGNIYILREIYVYEKDTGEIIELANKAALPKDKVMWCDSAEPDRIKTWKKAGYRARPVVKEKHSGKTYEVAQIDWLKNRKIFVHPSCTNTISELRQWKWKKDDKLGIYLDETVEFFDDAMAALRYGAEGWRKPFGMTVLKPGGNR
jgi:phage terminase large subunit